MKLAASLLAACAAGFPASAYAVDVREPTTVTAGILTDRAGMTLYTYDRDQEDSGNSACNGPCAAAWPPFLAGEDEAASSDFTTIIREDGRRQWTYQGKPLYYWSRDRRPGDRRGDGRNGVWRAVRP